MIANLKIAQAGKKDEFYTQCDTIDDELRHYCFEGKVIYCNCDTPDTSQFVKYLIDNFYVLGLKRVIATGYAEQSPYFDSTENKGLIFDGAYQYFTLKGNGDFRSPECVDLLRQADVIITNPPFSLFKEYIKQLFKYDKQFLIIGNVLALQYKAIFPLLQNDKIWLGCTLRGALVEFEVPSHYPLYATEARTKHGKQYINLKGVRWFTNIPHNQHPDPIPLTDTTNDRTYAQYDNYEAIEVNKTKHIPAGYTGVMGVPVTFLDKHNPDQFELLGLAQKCGYGLHSTKAYNDFIEVRPDGTPTGSTGKKTNGNPMMKGKPSKGNYYIRKHDGYTVHSLFSRVFIKHKTTT